MAKKTSATDSDAAEALSREHGVERMYRTTDGQWFTSQDRATAHAARANVELIKDKDNATKN